MGINFGGGSSSGSTQAVVTPEQTEQNRLTNQLLSTIVPSYQGVTKGAQEALDLARPNILSAAKQGFDQSSTVANQLSQTGLNALGDASKSLKNIISPDFIKNQIQGNLQPIIESNRDLTSSLNNQFLGAGQGGSSRHAFSQSNLQGLNDARLQAAGIKSISDITGQQISAASGLGTAGANAVTGASSANKDALSFAGVPQTAYQQFANTIFGVPGGASTGNFAGTQGQNTSSKGFGMSGKASG